MRVYFHATFERQFRKLDRKIKQHFFDRLRRFEMDPFSPELHNHALKGVFEGYRSINVTGDWRAIYKPLGENAVEFDAISTHSQLYG